MAINTEGIGKATINEYVKDIKEKVLGGTIFGVMVIEEDINSIIVAAYYLGRHEVRDAPRGGAFE